LDDVHGIQDRGIYKSFIIERNQPWVDKIENAFAEGKQKIFVAVGMDHLFGPDGIVYKLMEDGFRPRDERTVLIANSPPAIPALLAKQKATLDSCEKPSAKLKKSLTSKFSCRYYDCTPYGDFKESDCLFIQSQ
jgi:hypothetical protein